MNYKYFKTFSGPIIDHLRENWTELRDDFFSNVANSKIVGTKPWYVFGDGVTSLYRGKIQSAALKLSKISLDADEKKFIGWAEDDQYRWNYRNANVTTDPDTKIRNIKYTGGNWLKSPWAEFVDKFDDQLEQMFFNIAYPGAEITPHLGISSSYFRVHVCIQNNSGFVFDIAGEKKRWEEGVDANFAFDDGNLRHGVTYEDRGQNNPRIVAIIDVKKKYYPEMFGV